MPTAPRALTTQRAGPGLRTQLLFHSFGWCAPCKTRGVLHVGDPAPHFELLDHRGALVDSDDLAGAWVLLWWYPKAATPG